MTIELPQHLKPTANLLSGSLHQHSGDIPPPIPCSLANDLNAKGLEGSNTPPAVRCRRNWVETVRRVFSSPAAGLAAALLVVFGFYTPISPPLSQTEPFKESFRGSQLVHNSSDSRIVLITNGTETRQILEDSELFDMAIVVETADPLYAASITTAKLLVDVKGGAIVAYNTKGREVFADQLPADRTKIAERIALAFGSL